MTIADKIRSMTDEEVAAYFADMDYCSPRVDDCDIYTTTGIRRDCKRCWLDWLREEAKA